MLGKKNTLSRISKRKMRTSAISVLMSLVLISTPVYPDEMEMEEYVDYDDGSYDSYDYSYEDFSYDDYSYDDSNDDSGDDSGYEESGQDESGGNDDTGSEDTGNSNESEESDDSSEENTDETSSNNTETQENTDNGNESSSDVDESENTVGQESSNEDMTMTTNDTDTDGNSDEYVESTMDVQYESGGQADTAETGNTGSTNTIDLTGDPLTDIVTILTNELNELKEAIIKVMDMMVVTDDSDRVEESMVTDESGNQEESPEPSHDDMSSENTNDEINTDESGSRNVKDPDEHNDESSTDQNVDDPNHQIDLTDDENHEEIIEQEEILETQYASEEIFEPDDSNKSEEDKDDASEENKDKEQDDNYINLDPKDDSENPEEQASDSKDDAENHEEQTPDQEGQDIGPDQEQTETQDKEKPEENDPTDDNHQRQEQIVTEEQTDMEKQKEQEQQEIIELIGEDQQIIDLTGQDQEVVDLVQAIEDGQKPYSEEELVTEMVVDIIDLAEEISTTNSSGSGYSTGYSYNGGYSSATYMNTFNSQPHQQTREEWMNSLTPYERMLTGMTKTEERPATVSSDVNIYSGRSEGNTIVGVLPTGGVCYILEDGEWAYIESGEVRGFVRASDLSEGNIANNINVLPRAESMIDPNFNDAFNYLNITTSQIPEMPSNGTKKGIDLGDSISRNEVVTYAMQTDSLMNSPSGFVKDVYSHFGISLPDSTNDQSYVGERIEAENVRPGDLIFYKENGVINDVLIYIGDGKVIRLGENGKQVEDIDPDRVCWATRLIPGATQASEFSEIGQKAAAGDETARNEIIVALADASEDEWNTYGFPRSVLIAEAIMESNWLSFGDADNGGMQPEDNNIMNMNEHLRNDEWESPWGGDMIQRNIPRYENGEIIYGNEMMRAYNDIESCFNDYAAFKTDQHPNLEGETDIDIIIEEGLQGYATDPDYQASIKRIIEQYELTQFDNLVIAGAGNYTDSTNYTQDQLELIWAITAQEDDTSYEGALAVISTAMNRADQNYGGHGADALSQLTADGQFCYSPSVSDPIYYQRRLNGNVPEFVKQAVFDCLENGVRNHSYLNFRSSNRTGNYTQIGGNWFF